MTTDYDPQNWQFYLNDQGKSAHTIRAYVRAVKQFITWNEFTYGDEEAFDPARIIPRDITDWKSYQQTSAKASPPSVNQRLSALSKYFDWCITLGIRADNPAQGVKGLAIPKLKPQALPAQDQRRFLRAAYSEGNLRDIAIIELFLGAGPRVEELLALQIGDLQIGPRSGVVVIREGKGGEYREIPLISHVRKALSNYLARHPAPDDPGAALWLGQRGALKDTRPFSACWASTPTLPV